MQLAAWLREVVWRAADWRACLRELLVGERRAPRLHELGRACEEIDPDRQVALEAYTLAWRAGANTGALAAARRIAREIRAHHTIAELAMAEHERAGDPAHLIVAAYAYIDAGEP